MATYEFNQHSYNHIDCFEIVNVIVQIGFKIVPEIFGRSFSRVVLLKNLVIFGLYLGFQIALENCTAF